MVYSRVLSDRQVTLVSSQDTPCLRKGCPVFQIGRSSCYTCHQIPSMISPLSCSETESFGERDCLETYGRWGSATR